MTQLTVDVIPTGDGALRRSVVTSPSNKILDMIVAIARIPGNPGYLEPILQSAFGGIRLPTAVEPA